jgi:hypothetical protein
MNHTRHEHGLPTICVGSEGSPIRLLYEYPTTMQKCVGMPEMCLESYLSVRFKDGYLRGNFRRAVAHFKQTKENLKSYL